MCANRIYVHESIYDEFVQKLAATVEKDLKVGDGIAPGTTQGPLINKKAVEKVHYIKILYNIKNSKILSLRVHMGMTAFCLWVHMGMTAKKKWSIGHM